MNIIDANTKQTSFAGMNPEQAFKLLAEMPDYGYDQIRKEVAKDLGIQISTLDKNVIDLRKVKTNSANDGEMFEAVEMHDRPVNAAEMLERIENSCKKFIICDEPTRDAVALWIALTYVTEYVDTLPIANITAPEKNCGKSTLLTFIGKLAYRPLVTSNVSASALFRSIDEWSPTLLIDEADSFSDDAGELRGIINAGHSRDSAFVLRCVGDDHKPKKFNVWAPKAIAGIGRRAGTIESRSVDLRLRRKRADEKTLRMKAGSQEFAEIKQYLSRWAHDEGSKLKAFEPNLPAQLQNRDADNWEPLIAIADLAGGEWPKKARIAAISLTKQDEGLSLEQELLADIQTVLDERRTTHIFTCDLLEALLTMDDSPWPTYNRGKQLSSRQLSNKLNNFGIKPSTKRIGSVTKKGYSRLDFEDSFARYLTPAILAVTPSQPNNDVACSNFQSVTSNSSVTHEKTPQANEIEGCDGVTDRKGDAGKVKKWKEAI